MSKKKREKSVAELIHGPDAAGIEAMRAEAKAKWDAMLAESERKTGRRFHRYKVGPFSGPRYRDYSNRCPGDKTPCAICGKPTNPDDAEHWAIVTDGGISWGDEHSDENDGGYMGAWPVGNDCHRKHLDLLEGKR